MDPKDMMQLRVPPGFRSISDPDLMRLPHPRRLDLSGFPQMFDQLMKAGFKNPADVFAAPGQSLALTSERFAQNIGVDPLLLNSGPGTTNLGSLHTHSAVMRFRHQRSQVLTLPDDINKRPSELIADPHLPAADFRFPGQSVFVEFGTARDGPGYIHNEMSGRHVIEGGYVFDAEIQPHPATYDTVLMQALGIRPDLPYRVLDYVICGTPVGKNNYLDDATHVVTIMFQGDQGLKNIEALARRQYEIYHATLAGHSFWQPVHPDEVEAVIGAVRHINAALLYLRSPGSMPP